MLFLVACLVYWSFFPAFRVEQNLSIPIFLLLHLSLTLITCGGYLINDKHDMQTDAVNQKSKKHHALLKSAYFYHIYLSLSISGVIIGCVISIIYSNWFAFCSYIFAFLILHFYNHYLKGKLLLGNLSTSLLISLALLLYPSFEINLLDFKSHPTRILYFFALSSFLINLSREIIKDIEDIQGDHADGLQTLPIMAGKERSKNLAFFLLIISAILSVFFYTFYFLQISYLLQLSYALIIVPTLIIAYFITKAKKQKQFKRLSFALKILALVGLFSLVLFTWI
ncbi:MAG: UbiA family prenyltransferase [Psychroflexus sp.]|nr:UbiA family prenyltransferase [Psychroflexus sp.]MDN6309811.1 UbiA family prenyltransferase [Psychroflexus sp.]